MAHSKCLLCAVVIFQLITSCQARADVTLALVNDNPTFNITVAENYLYVTGVGGKLKSVSSLLLDLRSTGDEIPASMDAISLNPATQVGNVWRIPVKIKPELLPKASQYHAIIQISAESETGDAINPLNKPIQLVRPVVEFQVGDGSKPQRIRLMRKWPFLKDATGSASFTYHPQIVLAPPPGIGSGDVYTIIGSNAYRVGTASLTGSLTPEPTDKSSASQSTTSRFSVSA